MIIDFCHSFKDYDQILNFYGLWEYSCPKCNAAHSLHRHAKYSRYLILWEDGELRDIRMEVLRLQCSSCKTTHAILTLDMIPFVLYSVQAVLSLVSLCLQEDGSVLKTESITGVSYPLLYRLLTLFHHYHQRLLLFLRINGLWQGNAAPLARELITALTLHPPPWPQSVYFSTYFSPLFLNRHNTVTYPLRFGYQMP